MTRSTKRMLNALAKQGYTAEEQFIYALTHDINVRFKSVLWFNNRTIHAIKNGAISLQFGDY